MTNTAIVGELLWVLVDCIWKLSNDPWWRKYGLHLVVSEGESISGTPK